MSGVYGDDDDFSCGELTCPHCQSSMDGFEVFTHNHGSANPNCPACREPVEDDEWIQE